MSSKYPLLSADEVIAALKRGGFFRVSQKGSHVKMSNGSRKAVVPRHDEVARGTLKSILEQAGLNLDDFLELL